MLASAAATSAAVRVAGPEGRKTVLQTVDAPAAELVPEGAFGERSGKPKQHARGNYQFKHVHVYVRGAETDGYAGDVLPETVQAVRIFPPIRGHVRLF